MKYNIPFIKPVFPAPDELMREYESIVLSNWFTNFGPHERKFSQACAEYIGGDSYATTIANCTLGIEAAMAVLFDKEKTKVILPSFTFAAGVEATIRGGFNPLFVDIENHTWQPSIVHAKKIIKEEQEKIAGILLCNTFGVGNEKINEWEKLARAENIPLVIDSAAGFGSLYSPEEKVGSRGDCEVFSMHATKPFAIGEGGLVVSKNSETIERIKSWQNFGFSKDKLINAIGTNAKLQEINACIGLKQLENYETRLTTRRKTLQYYKHSLGYENYKYQQNDDLSTVPFASVFVKKGNVLELIHELDEAGIEARQYYSPLHLQPLIKEYVGLADNLNVTESIASNIICLPVHDSMKVSDIDKIVSIVKRHDK